jgi:Amt family ammonium transporter
LFHHGGFHQLGAQAVTVVAVVAYSFVVTLILGSALGGIMRNRGRVTPEQEEEGLDQSLHGESAYSR